MTQPRKEYVGDVFAVVSTCQRFLDKKYITRVEIPFSIHRKGDWGKCLDVVYITPAIVSLAESRDVALSYCRDMKYTEVEIVPEIDVLPEQGNHARPNDKQERAKKREGLYRRHKNKLN